MKNAELWESYAFYTGELTKYSRQLAFAGAAICWFFKTPTVTFPQPVSLSLLLLVCFFACDVLQYFLAAHLLRWWTRREEKKMWAAKKTIEGDYNKPWWIDSPIFIFFNLKAFFLVAAFAALGFEFLGRMTQ